MLDFFSNALSFSKRYFSFSIFILLNPTSVANKITLSERLDLESYNYLSLGLCILLSVWMLTAWPFRVGFHQFGLYIIVSIYLLVYIHIFAFTVWCLRYRKMNIEYTLKVMSYIIGLFVPFSLLVIEIIKIIILLPYLLAEKTKCPVVSFSCLIENYSLMSYDNYKEVELYISGLIGLIAIFYTMKLMSIVQNMGKISCLFVLIVCGLFMDKIFTIPILYIIGIAKNSGYL